MREISVTCPKCKKQGTIPISDLAEPQTAIYKCSCGFEAQIEGNMLDPKTHEMFRGFNDILGKVPDLLHQFRQTKLESVDIGVGKALSEEARRIAEVVLKEDVGLREDLRRTVHSMLQQYVAGWVDEMKRLDEGDEGGESA